MQLLELGSSVAILAQAISRLEPNRDRRSRNDTEEDYCSHKLIKRPSHAPVGHVPFTFHYSTSHARHVLPRPILSRLIHIPFCDPFCLVQKSSPARRAPKEHPATQATLHIESSVPGDSKIERVSKKHGGFTKESFDPSELKNRVMSESCTSHSRFTLSCYRVRGSPEV